jgi:hypothetical protein
MGAKSFWNKPILSNELSLGCVIETKEEWDA